MPRCIEDTKQFFHGVEVHLAVLQLEEIEDSVSCILCVTNYKEYEVDLFEIPHLRQKDKEPEDCVVLVLTRAVVKNNTKFPSYFAFT